MYQEWQGQTTLTTMDYAASRWSTATAVEMDGVAVTYAELSEEIARTRSALAALGVAKGDHLATLMGPGPEWAKVFYGALSLGAVVVPLNLTWSPPELTQALNLTDATFLLLESHFRGQDLIDLIEVALPELGNVAGPLALSEAPSLSGIIALPSEGHEVSFPSYVTPLADSPTHVPPGDVTPEDTALLLLTSGSTSFPKAAMISHRALVCGWATYADGLELTSDSVFLNYAPNYHIGGIQVMGMSLLRGARNIMMRWFDPEVAMRLIDSEKVTQLWGFDTHFSMMRDAPGYGKFDLGSVVSTISASNIGTASVQSFLDMGFAHHGSVYASTEYTGTQSYFPLRDIADTTRMMTSNGRATSGELRIIDIETGEALSPFASGEICVRGPALFSGYYNQPEETAKCMDAEGFFHSGDRGYLDDAGYLFFQGRYKEMIKSGGENVSIVEIEHFLMTNIEGVRHVAVCATPDAKWGEAVTATFVVDPSAEVTPESVKEACRGRLAPYKVPKKFVFIDEDQWLVTATGKINRQGLRDLTLSRLGIEAP